MKVEDIALGSRGMLMQAVFQHRRKHRLELPRRFEAPPEVFMTLKADLPVHETAPGLSMDSFRWLGIEIRIAGQRREPVMITCDNVAEPL